MSKAFVVDPIRLQKIADGARTVKDISRKLGCDRNTAAALLKRHNIKFKSTYSFRYKSAPGEVFGKFTVLSTYTGTSTNGDKRRRAKARCVCGNEVDTRLENIVNFRLKSCGCSSYEGRTQPSGSASPFFKGYGEFPGWKFVEIKKAAAARSLEFKVTKKYLWELYEQQGRKCALTGWPIQFGRSHYYNETTASLDRIDNRKGYVKGNLQWIFKDLNKMRGKLDIEPFLKLCYAVTDYRRDKSCV